MSGLSSAANPLDCPEADFDLDDWQDEFEDQCAFDLPPEEPCNNNDTYLSEYCSLPAKVRISLIKRNIPRPPHVVDVAASDCTSPRPLPDIASEILASRFPSFGTVRSIGSRISSSSSSGAVFGSGGGPGGPCSGGVGGGPGGSSSSSSCDIVSAPAGFVRSEVDALNSGARFKRAPHQYYDKIAGSGSGLASSGSGRRRGSGGPGPGASGSGSLKGLMESGRGAQDERVSVEMDPKGTFPQTRASDFKDQIATSRFAKLHGISSEAIQNNISRLSSQNILLFDKVQYVQLPEKDNIPNNHEDSQPDRDEF